MEFDTAFDKHNSSTSLNNSGVDTSATMAAFEEAYSDLNYAHMAENSTEIQLPELDFRPESDRVEETDSNSSSKPDELTPSPYIYSAAFKLFEDMGLSIDGWRPNNEVQESAIENAIGLQSELSLVPETILDGAASKLTPAPVNSFLRSRGFDIQLDPAGTPAIYVAATITLEGSWSGRERQLIDSDGNEYPGFVKPASVYSVDGNPVVKLYTDPETGFEMYVAPTDANLEGELAYEMAEQLTPSGSDRRLDFDSVHMPMVDLNIEQGLEELVGLEWQGIDDNYLISQALLQTILQLDHNGFDARQALAMTAETKSASRAPHTFEVDSRFLVFFRHPDMSKPLLAIPVSEENWTRPNRD